MDLGKRISELRSLKGLTQTFVAARMGKTPQWLSNIEKGRRAIGATELYGIAVILEVDVAVFFAPSVNATFTKQKPTGTEGI